MGIGEKIPVREWEVVSITESTYAASPNSNNTVGKDRDEFSRATRLKYESINSPGRDVAETSHSLFVFGDLVFPPNQHENLPLEPEVLTEHENDDAHDYDEGETEDDAMPRNEPTGCVPIESSVMDEAIESYNNQNSDTSISDFPKDGDNDDVACNDLPCGAWWNRKVASLYSQTKEVNGFCSVCIAAAILGLLILGQHWQQERWQILQLKLQSGIFDKD